MDDRRNRVDERQYPLEDAPVAPGAVQPTSPTSWPGAPDPATEAARYERAERRVRQKRNFYRNLTSYGSVCLLTFVVNLFTSPGHWWFYWVVFGWGIAIILQAWSVFVPQFDSDWEARQIQSELRKKP